MVIPLFVGRPKSIKAMETAMESGKSILLVAQKSAAKDDPGPEDMYAIGCVSTILQMLKLPDGRVKILVQGLTRAKIERFVQTRPSYIVGIKKIKEPAVTESNLELEALIDPTGATSPTAVVVRLSIPEDDTTPYAPVLLPLQRLFQAVETDHALHADGLRQR